MILHCNSKSFASHRLKHKLISFDPCQGLQTCSSSHQLHRFSLSALCRSCQRDLKDLKVSVPFSKTGHSMEKNRGVLPVFHASPKTEDPRVLPGPFTCEVANAKRRVDQGSSRSARSVRIDCLFYLSYDDIDVLPYDMTWMLIDLCMKQTLQLSIGLRDGLSIAESC